MVAGDDDDRVVELSGGFERGDHASQVAVEVFDLEAVVENLAARLGSVRQPGGQPGVFQLLPRPLPGADVVVLVRLGRTQPKEEGLALIALDEELIEVRGVVDRVDAGAGVFQTLRRVDLAEDLARPTRTHFAGAPSLAGGAELIPGVSEQQREHLKLRAQHAQQDAAFLDFPNVAAGQNGAARRRAGRRGGIGVVKQDAFASDAIERGRFCRRVAVSAGVHGRLIVGDHKQNVRPPGLRPSGDGQQTGDGG